MIYRAGDHVLVGLWSAPCWWPPPHFSGTRASRFLAKWTRQRWWDAPAKQRVRVMPLAEVPQGCSSKVPTLVAVSA
jgi:hypothetical protein